MPLALTSSGMVRARFSCLLRPLSAALTGAQFYGDMPFSALGSKTDKQQAADFEQFKGDCWKSNKALTATAFASLHCSYRSIVSGAAQGLA